MTFQSKLGMSILDAASEAKVLLPYSCRTGRCSTCKCKVVNGTTKAIYPECGLSAQEKEDGWILSCIRSAETDVLLDVDDLGVLALPPVKTLPCRISQIHKLTHNVVQVFLRLPPTAEFKFISGQYINVIGPSGIRRSYSLANSSTLEKTLELHIREVEGGAMSQYWFNQAKINDLLRLNGPLGTFLLRETANIDVFFLATGTGIAPIKAMMESLAHRPAAEKPKSVTVLWGGRQSDDFYLDASAIQGEHICIPVHSRPHESWSGAKGYVQDVLASSVPNWKNAAVYACGSDAMIHSAKKTLTDAGLPVKRFYSDAFVCSASN